jgi:hypothetical protein
MFTVSHHIIFLYLPKYIYIWQQQQFVAVLEVLSALTFIGWFMNKGRDYQKSVIWIPLDNYPPLFRKNNNMNHIPHDHELILAKLQVKQKKEEQDVNLDAIVVGDGEKSDNEIEMKQITMHKSAKEDEVPVVSKDEAAMVVVDKDNLKKKDDDDKDKEEETSLVYILLTCICM